MIYIFKILFKIFSIHNRIMQIKSYHVCPKRSYQLILALDPNLI